MITPNHFLFAATRSGARTRRRAPLRVAAKLLPLSALFLTGCHFGMAIPEDWQRVESPPRAKAPGAEGKMQVILCFSNWLSNHSVMRLECPGRPTLFWDPGGFFAQRDANAERNHDVLRGDVPTPAEWWAFRRDMCSEGFHYVYEWDLTKASAQAKHDALLNLEDDFETDAGGGDCSRAVSAFLQRFATDQVWIPQHWGFPHELGWHLFAQPVDRLRVFRRHQDGEQVYVRNERRLAERTTE